MRGWVKGCAGAVMVAAIGVGAFVAGDVFACTNETVDAAKREFARLLELGRRPWRITVEQSDRSARAAYEAQRRSIGSLAEAQIAAVEAERDRAAGTRCAATFDEIAHEMRVELSVFRAGR